MPFIPSPNNDHNDMQMPENVVEILKEWQESKNVMKKQKKKL